MRVNLIENIGKKLKISGIGVLILLMTLGTAGCAKVDKAVVKENPAAEENIETQATPIPTEPSVTPQANNTGEEDATTDITSKEVDNNGSLYVAYQGNTFYRQYTADSYEAEGLFGTYNSVADSLKNMMYKKSDGTVEIAFSDVGEGDIYICNDNMYLMKTGADYISTVYSVGLDGKGEQVIGTGQILGIDETTQTLVCMLADETDTYQLFKVNGVTGEAVKYGLQVPYSSFLTLQGGVIYYLGEVKFEAAQMGEVKLCSVKVDGTDEKLLADTAADLYEYGDREAVIPCIQLVGDTIYFSYGAYGGTGNFYQGGRIAKVMTDGSDFEILLGNPDANGDPVTIADIFYVAQDKGEDLLYYSQGGEEYTKNILQISTGEISETDLPIFAEGDPFEYEEGISVYLNQSASSTNWIPKVDYSLLKLDDGVDYLYTVTNIELCDDWVYYQIEANESAPEVSVGWRDGYRRIKTIVMREELEGDKVETLYEY